MNRALRTVLALVALLAALLPAVALSPAAAKATDIYNCSDYDHVTSPWRYAQNKFYSYGGPVKDPHKLDGDRDGYACEDLAKISPVPNEPDCNFDVNDDDCAGRDQIRNAFWLSSQEAKLPTAAKDLAMKGMLLDNFAAQASTGSELSKRLRTSLIEAYGAVESSRNNCIRQAVFTFLKIQVDAEKFSDAFITLLGTGQKVIKALPGKSPADLAAKWMEVGASTAKTASEVALTARAIDALDEASTCF